jgi:hypothetical protein
MALKRRCIPVGSGGARRVFARMMEGLATSDAERKTVMIDATCLKAHRTASSPAAFFSAITFAAAVIFWL